MLEKHVVQKETREACARCQEVPLLKRAEKKKTKILVRNFLFMVLVVEDDVK